MTLVNRSIALRKSFIAPVRPTEGILTGAETAPVKSTGTAYDNSLEVSSDVTAAAFDCAKTALGKDARWSFGTWRNCGGLSASRPIGSQEFLKVRVRIWLRENWRHISAGLNSR